MVYLSDLFDTALFGQHVEDGLITIRKHPTLPLSVANYSKNAQYKGLDSIMEQCRGLVFVSTTGEIVGRPFNKFYNYGEPQAPLFGMDDKVVVTDKNDGSMVVLSFYKGKPIASTRGSFTSEQAIAAQKRFDEMDLFAFKKRPNLTFIFEWVGPSNRIVLTYPEDELVLIGAVNKETGSVIHAGLASHYTGYAPHAKLLPYKTFGEALAAPPRTNAEGFVIFRGNDILKLKQEDYVVLHRLVTGLNERTVWESIVNGTFSDLRRKMPEEFIEWIDRVEDEIMENVVTIEADVAEAWEEISHSKPQSRKDFAMAAVQYKGLTSYLFAVYDGRDIRPMVLKNCKPKTSSSLVSEEET